MRAGRRRGRRAPHRGPDVGDEPRGHRAPAGDRRADGRDDLAADRPPPVADADRAVRGPGRAAVAGRADPGPLRAPARRRARDLLRADLPDRGRRDRPPPVRARRAAAHPRPAGHGLVARRAAARVRSPRTTCSRARTASSWTGRPGPATGSRGSASWRRSTTGSSGCRSATSRSSASRAGARRSPPIFDLPEFLPYLPVIRRVSVAYAAGDETGAPGTTNVVKPLYHVAWLASRLGLRVVAPLAPVEPTRRRPAAPRLRPGEKPPLHRGLAARLVAPVARRRRWAS